MAVILQGRHAAILDDFDRQRMVAYEHAQWLAIAFHDPKKLPAFEWRAQQQTADERQRLVDDAKVRGWFISMSMAKH